MSGKTKKQQEDITSNYIACSDVQAAEAGEAADKLPSWKEKDGTWEK